jgi:hypothetical protein
MASNRLTCERCGSNFDCSPSSDGECWCAKETYRLPMPSARENSGIKSCLCPSCLRKIAAHGSTMVPDKGSAAGI